MRRWVSHIQFHLLWPFYLTQILQSVFLLTTAYWVVFFLNIGHPLARISLLPIAMLVTMLLLEMPTGFLADLRGRKQMVVIGIFLEAIATGLIPIVAGRQFEILIVLYALMGAGAAFISGALEAWVVDYLHWHARPQVVPGYYAAAHSLFNIGFIASPLLASMILFFTKDMRYLWWVEAAALFAAGLILTLFASEKITAQPRQASGRLLYREAVTTFLNNPALKQLSAIIFIVAIVFGITFLFWQPFLQQKGVPLSWFGIMFAFSSILAIIYPIIQPGLRNRLEKTKLLKLIFIVQILGFVGLMFVPVLGIIVLFLILQNLDSLKLPLIRPWIQEHIPAAVRSTVGSFMAMVGALGEGIGYLIAGQLAGPLDGNSIWLLASLLSLAAIFMLYVPWQRRLNSPALIQ